MKNLMFVVLVAASQITHASGFHYCAGKVTNLVTRASPEESQVTIEGMTGWARLGYGGTSQSEMHKRQFSMLLSAYMAGKSVTLEFEDSLLNCSDNHDDLLIRYVRLSN